MIETLAARAYAAAGRLGAAREGGAEEPAPAKGFAEEVAGVLGGVASSARAADGGMASAFAGQADLLEVVTSVAEAETRLETLVALRDRVVAAYEDVLRMQI